MRINYNALAMNATTNFGKINNKVAKSMSRLSSGYKITSPADDAAGLAISKKMSAQIRGLDRAALNSNDGISVIQSAEGGMEEMHSILGRMRELAVQAANDVNDEVDRDAIQEEIDSLAAELTQISDTTAFNGQTIFVAVSIGDTATCGTEWGSDETFPVQCQWCESNIHFIRGKHGCLFDQCHSRCRAGIYDDRIYLFYSRDHKRAGRNFEGKWICNRDRGRHDDGGCIWKDPDQPCQDQY